MLSPVGCHSIHANYCTDCCRKLIGALISHHSNRLNRQQNCQSLPDIIIYFIFTQCTDEDVISLPEQFETLFRDRPHYPDPEPGAGTPMSAYTVFGNAP